MRARSSASLLLRQVHASAIRRTAGGDLVGVCTPSSVTPGGRPSCRRFPDHFRAGRWRERTAGGLDLVSSRRVEECPAGRRRKAGRWSGLEVVTLLAPTRPSSPPGGAKGIERLEVCIPGRVGHLFRSRPAGHSRPGHPELPAPPEAPLARRRTTGTRSAQAGSRALLRRP
jgi:hypothetical protein